ncbi:MAG: phage tail protein [Caldilineaceae bacterium]
MSDLVSTRLYNLLPELYRWRDEQQGKPLQAFLAILEREFRALEMDTEAMYDNWFIQTCDNWVVPYLGDLLGVRDQVVQIDYLPFTQRRRVANTLAYRRRKGTAAVLEQVLWDVTNWHVRAVEFGRLLAMTQHLQYIQDDRATFVNLQDMPALAALESPFTTLPRSIDIRTATSGPDKAQTDKTHQITRTTSGQYSPHNVGLFFWRLRPYPVSRGIPQQKADTPFFTFSPTGHDLQLFNQPQAFIALEQRATAINMPIPLTRAELAADLNRQRRQAKDRPLDQLPLSSSYYGADRSFSIMDVREIELFSQANQLVDAAGLNNGVLTNELRQKFVDKGILLSQNCNVRLIEKDKSWQLEDVNLGKSYRVAVEKAMLRIWRIREQILPFYIFSADLSEQPTLPKLRAYYSPSLFSVPAEAAPAMDKLHAAFQAQGLPLTDKAVLTKVTEDQYIIVDAQQEYLLERTESGPFQVYDDKHAPVLVDPELGRIAFLSAVSKHQAKQLRVDYTYGFSGDVGGGPYPRHFAVADAWQNYCEILVAVGSKNTPLAEVKEQSQLLVANSFRYALRLWNRYCEQVSDKPRALIRILDNGIYPVHQPTLRAKAKAIIHLPIGAELSIVAEDGVQPTLNTPIEIDFHAAASRAGARRSGVTALAQTPNVGEAAPIVDRKLLLSGLRMVGGLGVGNVAPADLNAFDLVIEHCSLLEGGIRVDQADINAPAVKLSLLRTISGPLHLPANMAGLQITESIIDCQLAPSSEQTTAALVGPTATLARATFFGQVHVQGELQANAVLFTAPVTVDSGNAQVKGLLRYCYLPAGSQTPTDDDDCLYEDTKPADSATARDQIARPVFSSRRYGHPGYAQLSKLSPPEILDRVGKIAEIGVFYHLYQPQRATNIQTMLAEYLPLGLDAGIFHVT